MKPRVKFCKEQLGEHDLEQKILKVIMAENNHMKRQENVYLNKVHLNDSPNALNLCIYWFMRCSAV